MMATFMLVMIPRAAVCAERITEVLDTESTVVPTDAPDRRRRVARHRRDARRDVPVPRRRRAGAVRRLVHRAAPARPRRSSAAPARARPRCSRSSRACSTRPAARCSSTASTSATSSPTCCARGSASCRRRPTCSAAPSRATCATAREDATDDELWEALRIAQADDFVAAIAEGLEAPIAQGGTNVSGGQRQRLAIARALVRKPRDLPLRRLVLRARPRDRRAAARGAAGRRRASPR